MRRPCKCPFNKHVILHRHATHKDVMIECMMCGAMCYLEGKFPKFKKVQKDELVWSR